MGWSYSPNEFVKIYRKLINWGWYTDVCTCKLFLHCLLRANWKPGLWQGIHYDKGEFITSIPSLAEESGLTVSQTRTALKHLISTGEIGSRLTDTVTGKKLTKNRIITVKNWDAYQSNDRQNDRQIAGNVTDKRQASDRQVTADIRIKEYQERKEIKEKPAALSSSKDEEFEEFARIQNERMARQAEKERRLRKESNGTL